MSQLEKEELLLSKYGIILQKSDKNFIILKDEKTGEIHSFVEGLECFKVRGKLIAVDIAKEIDDFNVIKVEDKLVKSNVFNPSDSHQDF